MTGSRPGPARPPGAGRSTGPPAPAGRWDRLRRYLPVVAVLTLCLVVVAGLAIAPARTYLSQRRETSDAEAELHRLQSEVAELDSHLEVLRTDEAVQRIARENYDLVFPGEESFRILPAPEPEPDPAAPAAPADGSVAGDPQE